MNIWPTISVLILAFHISSISSWNLLHLKLQNSTFKLRHVSRLYLRIFLTIENHNNTERIPTLIESTWPENFLPFHPKVFPNIKAHARSPTDCQRIQQAGWTYVDDIGRLWLLDIGNKYCYPKLIIYDLLARNFEIYRTPCPFQYGTVNSMKLIDFGITLSQHVAFFTFNHGEFIWAFHVFSETWKKFKFFNNNIQIFIQQLAFTKNSKLYLADKFSKLYTTELQFNLRFSEVKLIELGDLLGTPDYLIADPFGKLYYNSPQYGAVVRCDPLADTMVEEHEILLLHSMPIVQIFFGIGGTVWVAFEKMIIHDDHCDRILYHFTMSSEFSGIN